MKGKRINYLCCLGTFGVPKRGSLYFVLEPNALKFSAILLSTSPSFASVLRVCWILVWFDFIGMKEYYIDESLRTKGMMISS